MGGVIGNQGGGTSWNWNGFGTGNNGGAGSNGILGISRGNHCCSIPSHKPPSYKLYSDDFKLYDILVFILNLFQFTHC